MDLKMYLRQHIANKVVPLFKDIKCKRCGSDNELHLHHEEAFADMLDKTLLELNLQLLDMTEYTKAQLNLIRWVVLGKHLDIKYKTLCKKCHISLHKDNGNVFALRAKKKREEKIKEDTVKIIEYLSANVGKVMLTLPDREELISIINLKSNNGKSLRGLTSINKALRDRKCGFSIKSFETSKIINGKREKFQSAWKIISVTDR
ncbi:hypothetical protein [Paenibacillus sp. NPDC093718]|uniref:hypothetical protein n=1 Tax=Paenibacillus sp. NPDC093718 TaxID=3390601 RepID=UPI003D08ED13